MSADAPSVSVVTPFYNTAPYLDACIASVVAQTRTDFEYLLVNNRSTDGSAEIARGWAARDPRIRVVDQPSFLGQVENYNAALRHVGPAARWVKIVQADDWLYPECLERMVAAGERDPGVVLVGSFYRFGDLVLFQGLPADRGVHEGRDVCRWQLLARHFFMGNPTTLLYRADAVRARTPFFEPGRFHEDGEVCFELLERARFGFVPQVLSFVRTDNAEASITMARQDDDLLAALRYTMVRRYGRTYLSVPEYTAADAAVTREYWWRLLRGAATLRGPDYFSFHARRLAEVGEHLGPLTFLAWPLRFGAGYLRRLARGGARRLREALR